MSYTLSFANVNERLEVTAAGAIRSFAEFKEKSQAVVDRVLQAEAKRILLDYRELLLEIDTIDITRLAERHEKERLQLMGLRIGCLFHCGSEAVYRTMETVYRNRSLNFMLFASRGDAAAWLQDGADC